VSTPAVVLAKWTAALVAYVVTWMPTGLYLAILRKAGPLDWHVVATSYLGVILIGASLLALGLLASSVSKNQFVALVIGLAASIGLFILGIGAFVFDEGIVHDLCRYVSIWAQMGSFSKGIIDSRSIVFHVSVTAWALFTTSRVVDSWRWG
jgi:ABC-2 type transport system permease protein